MQVQVTGHTWPMGHSWLTLDVVEQAKPRTSQGDDQGRTMAEFSKPNLSVCYGNVSVGHYQPFLKNETKRMEYTQVPNCLHMYMDVCSGGNIKCISYEDWALGFGFGIPQKRFALQNP